MKSLLTFTLIWMTCFAAWGTHIVYCLQNGRWGFLIAGALAFPIAIVHGFMIWAGLVS
jgi:hypothetical protein